MLAANVAADDPKSPAKGNYPKTPHLPFSPGVSPDDTRISDCKHILEAEVVVTEKWLNYSELSQIPIHSGPEVWKMIFLQGISSQVSS